MRRAALRWFGRHRRDLPWRKTTDPYAILVSEVMLQQTQVHRVIPKYRAFLRRFPTARRLAVARLGDVLREWSGLGYNSRARRLWLCAQAILGSHDGRMPRDEAELAELPGVGPYTAGAVASIAFGVRAAAIDTNARRVLSRVIGGRDRLPQQQVRAIAARALPRKHVAQWNQSLMDIGAIFCRATPRCEACPLRLSCRFARNRPSSSALRKSVAARRAKSIAGTRFVGSRRYYRGRIVRALIDEPNLGLRALGPKVKREFRETDVLWLVELLRGLARDGLIAFDERRGRARLP